ncbi:DUF4192 domain-containing protein [Amycolatopsis alba]|uniref:DUF4192 domain-containing protein n=1 Tax=Amycolatopsis alba TaxID=76020 RepID=UPI00037A7B87|nr:DUF4192 domain-containing protein [Amycolatopsis alba]
MFAAIPHLLGFVPHKSFVLIFIGNDPLRPNRSEMIARVSLDDVGQDPAALARHLTRSAMDHPIAAVIGLAVCPSSPEPGSALPYRTELLTLTHEIRQHGLRIDEVGHVPDFTEGATWQSYLAEDRTGRLPDPFATPVAATVVAEGLVTARSRDDLAAVFTPAGPALRARVAPLIFSALEQTRADRTQPDVARERLARAEGAITAATTGTLPAEDHEIADLIATFSVEPFRSAMFNDRSTKALHGVKALTTYLWRVAPEPCASNLAAIAGLHAYMLGGSTIARIAADAGTARLPLLSLLREVLDRQLSPRELKVVAILAGSEARAELDAFGPAEGPQGAEPNEAAAGPCEPIDRLSRN